MEEIITGEVVSNGTFTTTDPQCDVDIRMGDGAAARAPVTVGDALRRTAAAVPSKVALRVALQSLSTEELQALLYKLERSPPPARPAAAAAAGGGGGGGGEGAA